MPRPTDVSKVNHLGRATRNFNSAARKHAASKVELDRAAEVLREYGRDPAELLDKLADISATLDTFKRGKS